MVFDPRAAAKREVDEARKVARAELDTNAKMPWQIDGRAWHTRDRKTRTGKPARWEGAILDHVVDLLAELGGFPEPDWSRRSVVRVASPDPTAPPFLEAFTGHEWVVSLRFLVKSHTFQADTLAAALGLLPFSQSPRPVLSDSARVTVNVLRGVGQEVTLTFHLAQDVQTLGLQRLPPEGRRRRHWQPRKQRRRRSRLEGGQAAWQEGPGREGQTAHEDMIM